MNYDDAFSLEEVSEPLLDKFNFVAGIVPVLTTYLTQVAFWLNSYYAFSVQVIFHNHVSMYVSLQRNLSDSVLTSQEALSVTGALEELANYIAESSKKTEVKERQKLLRNLRILEIIKDILSLFKPDAPDARQVLCPCVFVYVCYVCLILDTYVHTCRYLYSFWITEYIIVLCA